MFTVYGVKVVRGQKHRHCMGSFEDRDKAIFLCRRLDCTYGYVKEFGAGTVYFLPLSADYYEHPKDAPPLKIRPLSPQALQGTMD